MLNRFSGALRAFLLPLFVAAGMSLVCCSATRTAAADPARASKRFTQYEINEIAAACLDCQIDCVGLSGLPRPGEDMNSFRNRIRGYLAAMDKVTTATRPLRQFQIPGALDAANTARWQRISRVAEAMPEAVKRARMELDSTRALSPRSQLGPRLKACLMLVHALLESLRDARP